MVPAKCRHGELVRALAVVMSGVTLCHIVLVALSLSHAGICLRLFSITVTCVPLPGVSGWHVP